MQVAKLTADLVTKTSQFESGLKRANNALLQSKGVMTSALGSMDVSFKKLGATVGGFLAVNKLVGDFKKVVNYLDDVGDAAQRIGISTEAFSKLRYAAQQTETPLAALEKNLRKLQINLVAAASGENNKVAEALRFIGLEAKDLLNSDIDMALADIADGLNKIADPAIRAAAANDIFSKGFINIADLMNKGGNAIRQYGKEAEEAGIVISKEMADRAEEFKEAVNKISAQYQGLIIELTKEGALDAGIDVLAAFGKGISNLSKNISALRAEWRWFTGDLDKTNPQDLQILINKQTKRVESLAPQSGFGRWAADTNKQIFGTNPYEIEMKKLGVLYEQMELNNKVTKDREEADKKREEASNQQIEQEKEKNRLAYENQQISETQSDTYDKIISNLQKEAQQLGLQVELYGQKAGLQEKNRKELEINNQLQEAGIRLNAEQQKQIKGYLDKIETQTDALDTLNQKTEEAAEKERMRAQALNELGFAFQSNFEDAILAGKKLSDVLDSLLQDILRLMVRTQITQPIANFVSGSGGAGGGGLFSFVRGLFGFAGGIDNVPYDMVARIHQGERVLTADENRAFSSGMMGGGGDVTVNITNNSSAQVSSSSSNGANGAELNILIDQAVADNITRPGSRTNRALGAYKNRTLTRR